MGGKTPIGNAIMNVNTQLRSGWTRGKYSRELDADETTALERKRDDLVARQRDEKRTRIAARVNAHTTNETNRLSTIVVNEVN